LTQTTAKRIEVVRKGRHYQIPETKAVVPSVTNILGAINKPALVNWAANTERALVTEAAANLHEDMPTNGKKMSRVGYLTTLKDRIGKTKAHQKELTKAAEIGTQAHKLIEWHLRRQLLQKVGDEPQVSEKALWAFMAWEDWRNAVNLAPLAIEQTIWSSKHEYAGTMDLYAEFDLTRDLVDTQPEEFRDELTRYVGSRMRGVHDWKSSKRIYAEAGLQISSYREAMIDMGHAEHDAFGVIVRLPKMDTDPDFEVRIYPPSVCSRLFQIFLHVKSVWQWMKEEDAKSYDAWKASQQRASA
jgi:hypothetical protein